MLDAREVVFAHCSEQPCLLFAFNCVVSDAIERVNTLRKEINRSDEANLSTQAKTEALLPILKQKLKKQKRKTGQLAWMVDISLPDECDLKLVCKNCFCNIHGISPRTFDTLVKDTKDMKVSHKRAVPATLNMYTTRCREKLVDLMRSTGQPIPSNDVLVFAIPDTVPAMQAAAWFRHFYMSVGDIHQDGHYTLEVPSKNWLHSFYQMQCARFSQVSIDCCFVTDCLSVVWTVLLTACLPFCLVSGWSLFLSYCDADGRATGMDVCLFVLMPCFLFFNNNLTNYKCIFNYFRRCYRTQHSAGWYKQCLQTCDWKNIKKKVEPVACALI